ncbi:leucine--tRNA ligase [Candidatus Woesearchaeota archaeon]|nr:leucine--tRNA ligase [Candidatus Woesearchaeota archaeon]
MDRKWQEAWTKARIFEANANEQEKFFITIPYPYISGSLHIGHARVVTEADVYARFLRMKGKNVLFPIAFHISGTPVLGISLAIKNKDPQKIDLYKEYVRTYVKNEEEVERIVASFEDPQKIVDFFIPKMKDEFSTLGLSVDWRRSFTSGDIEHQKLVEWQFRKYRKSGYLVQGKYPVLYSVALANAVGEDDIIDGDLDPVEKQEFVLVKFPFGDQMLVAATLRPETLFGQTNVWVNPDVTYSVAQVGKERWIASEECFDKLILQEYNVTKTGTVKGRDLLGKYCTAPFLEKEIIILPSKHCDPDRGTGIVTSVPSDAPFDWMSLKTLQDSEDLCTEYHLDHKEIRKIQPIPIITSKGYGDLPAVTLCQKQGITSVLQKKELTEATQEIYKVGFHTGVMKETCGQYSGMATTKARDEMKAALLTGKKGAIIFETSRPAKARDGSKVVIAVIDKQWFLDFTVGKWKEHAREALKKMEVVPEKYRKQFEDTFLWLDKRPCARRRGLGTKLPFDPRWVIESLSDSTIYMALYPLCHLIRQYKLQEKHLTEDFFDYVLLGEGKADQCGVPRKVLDALHKEFSYWYPFDHRHTFAAHLSNHLSFMIFAHVAIFSKHQWPKKVTFHGMVLSEGEKMSKSKGNVVTLLEVNERYGADTFRAFMCNSTSVESTCNWETAEVEKMKNHLGTLCRILESCIAHRATGPLPKSTLSLISRVERITAQATEKLAAMELRDYATLVLFELMNWYKKGTRKLTREDLARVNEYILTRWLLLLAPLTPHLAEELWQKAGKKGFISIAAWPHADISKINAIAEYKEEFIENIENDIRTVCRLVNVQPKEITLFVADHWKSELVSLVKDLLKETHDQKTIFNAVMKTDLRKRGEDVTKILPALLKDVGKIPTFVLGQEDEQATLHDACADLEQTFGCNIKIMMADKTTEQKARAALPGKPAILVR